MGERWPREKETVNGGRVEEIGGEGGRERWKERNRGGKVEAGGSRWRQSCSLGWLAGWLQGKCSCGAWPSATPDPE